MKNQLPRHNPKKLLQAWTPEEYKGGNPMFVNVTQVGSMVEIILRGPANPDGSCGASIIMTVNNWTLDKLGRVLRDASNNFECGFEERVFEEHQADESQASDNLER